MLHSSAKSIKIAKLRQIFLRKKFRKKSRSAGKPEWGPFTRLKRIALTENVKT